MRMTGSIRADRAVGRSVEGAHAVGMQKIVMKNPGLMRMFMSRAPSSVHTRGGLRKVDEVLEVVERAASGRKSRQKLLPTRLFFVGVTEVDVTMYQWRRFGTQLLQTQYVSVARCLAPAPVGSQPASHAPVRAIAKDALVG